MIVIRNIDCCTEEHREDIVRILDDLPVHYELWSKQLHKAINKMNDEELRWEYIGKFFQEFNRKPTVKELKDYMNNDSQSYKNNEK